MAGDTRSILEMSDEEIANLDPSTFNQEEPETNEAEVNDPVQTDPESETGDTSKDASDESSSEDSQGQSGALDSGDSKEESEESEEGSDADVAEGSKESNPEPKASEPKSEEAIDYEAMYKRLTAPFKANGREIQVNNVEDAISLMQMGANYNKKMAALKPNLKLLKLLENNGLLNEEKLSYLIDLDKKSPAAINKLIKDSGVDPLDLDAEKASEYKPTRHTVDDRELELDAVLDEIQTSPTYSRTLDVVSNVWDAASKNIIANTPQLLKVIDGHIQSGVYDMISKEVEREKMFGRLNGLSDIEAYRQVGDAIQARGGFDHLANQGQQTQPKPVVVAPKPKMGDEDKRREKKRAASSSQPAVPTKVKEEFNPLALSDEEFSKVVQQRFL